MMMVQNFLLALSKTDPKLFGLCPQEVRWSRIGLGIFVFLTGAFAFITSSYFVGTMFSTFNEVTQSTEISIYGRFVSIVIGFCWATLVVLIDREIVSAHSKWSALVRLPLALALGYAIALPVKIHVFSQTLNKELTIASREENREQEEFFMAEINTINENVSTLTQRRDNAIDLRNEWAVNKEAEISGRKLPGRSGMPNCGPRCREAERLEALYADLAAKYDEELSELITQKDDKILSAQNRFEKAKINQSYDFVSQYKQMQQLTSSDKDFAVLAWIITLIFIAIELIPALIKLLKDKDEYDILLEVRRRINIQTAIAYGNFAINDLQDSNDPLLLKGSYPYSSKEIVKQIALNF